MSLDLLFDWRDELAPLATCFQAVGSRVTCNPPPVDTDRDWLVLVEETKQEQFFKIANRTFKADGSFIPPNENTNDPDSVFLSLKHGEDNLIVTSSLKFYLRFLAASSVAKRLNLMDKNDRIALFRAVLYSEPC